MPRGGRNVPGLKEAWALKGKLLVKKYRGQVVVQAWPKAYGPPRSQAQADTITAFKQMQRAMKFQLPVEWVDAIESTTKTGMYPRDYLMSCMSGNMFMVQYMPGFAISAAIDMIADFTANSGDTLFTINNIPQGYKALHISVLARSLKAATSDFINITFNTDTGNHYSSIRWNQFGTSYLVNQAAISLLEITAANAPASFPAAADIFMPHYTNTAFAKSLLTRNTLALANSASNLIMENGAAWWNSTAILNRIDMSLPAGFVAGSRITAYGLY